MEATEARRWRFRGPEMEGPVARWYAGVRGSQSQLELYRQQARQLTASVPAGSRILEIAPGPGYLAVEMARLGRFEVAGLDISHTFVGIARENARKAGVSIDFQQGDVAGIPMPDGSFDLVVCQAAFKNFGLPRTALAEMFRVLRAGGSAVIDDMNHEASHADIEHEVKAMGLGRLRTFTTQATLEMLRRRAYTAGHFQDLASQSPFKTCDIERAGIGIRVRLTKPEAPVA
jgi:ubiquinone/menaquinone biosynthesis C-methylase UbiE